mmetsp:Transcript_12753/g.26572  ORF Transcript_12753/g.26572 Transcript_12753/m.26572 type:complete len:224 (-) Transcript_12753:34-705(-)
MSMSIWTDDREGGEGIEKGENLGLSKPCTAFSCCGENNMGQALAPGAATAPGDPAQRSSSDRQCSASLAWASKHCLSAPWSRALASSTGSLKPSHPSKHIDRKKSSCAPTGSGRLSTSGRSPSDISWEVDGALALSPGFGLAALAFIASTPSSKTVKTLAGRAAVWGSNSGRLRGCTTATEDPKPPLLMSDKALRGSRSSGRQVTTCPSGAKPIFDAGPGLSV